MKQIELLRKHVIRSLVSLRSYASCIPGNEDVVDRLRGADGEARIARIVGYVMQELGDVESKSPVENAASHVRRTVNKALAAARGE